MDIRIPFKGQFRKQMLNGTKRLTWRTKKYGYEGDIFEAFGRQFELTDVYPAPMVAVPQNWKEEGFDSPEEAIRFMVGLRPTGYKASRPGFHHRFRIIDEAGAGKADPGKCRGSLRGNRLLVSLSGFVPDSLSSSRASGNMKPGETGK